MQEQIGEAERSPEMAVSTSLRALATVAGWFYGSAYRAHRSLMASAITHALVDTLWRTFFTLPKG